jgi:hypothetical protein
MKNKNILIIHHTGNSYNNPTLKCVIDLFLLNGFYIDIRYNKSSAPMPLIKGVNLLPFGKLIARLKSLNFNYFCSNLFLFVSVAFENLFLYKNYDLIIAIDREGLIEANILNILTKKPYIFFSFEIMFENEVPKTYCKNYKKIERKASKKCSFWVVQDEVRAYHIQTENKLNPSTKFIIPLASSKIPKDLKLKRLRDDLNIPKEKKVAILIGSISKWTMTNDILKTLSEWPENWVLIIHERYGLTSESLNLESKFIKKYIGYKIYLSNSAPDMVDDLGYVLSGISVGLAFYKPTYEGQYTGNNLSYLGLASGKIATYLRYSIPVFVNEIGLYGDEVKKFKIGHVLQSPSQIPVFLPKMEMDNYSERAQSYFSSKLDFELYKNDFWNRIDSVLNKKINISNK